MTETRLFPRRKRGRQTSRDEQIYRAKLESFCDLVGQIASTLDFKVSSRGWCYILEEHGLGKGDFDEAQTRINECRKSGLLPLDICAEDNNRQAAHLDDLDSDDPDDYAADIVSRVQYQHIFYTPISFWRDLPVYIEMQVEKIDLRSLFGPVCSQFHVPLTNARGWSDLNSRAAIMRRFKYWERRGKQCVLLYCGDHDPAGLAISDCLRANLADLADAVGWSPVQLIIERFGLNADFIEAKRLTWIDGLETGSGRSLADPRHPDHKKSYVQDYLRRFGARKVEANALVVRPEAGRELCRQAILRHVPADAVADYERLLKIEREKVRLAIIDRLAGGAS
jgi:hypothetical protein